MSKLFDKAIIFQLANLYKADSKTVTKALAEDHTQAEVHRFSTELVANALSLLALPLKSYDHALDVCRRINPVLATRPADDPAESQWRSLGLVVPMQVSEDVYGEDVAPMAVAIAGTSSILLVAEQRERKLPSASINDKLTDRIAAFEKAEGRAAHKKDIAMLKDEITAKMLKTAPITRKRVPVLLQDGLCVMFTSSSKLADEVGAMLRSLFGTWPAMPVLLDQGYVANWLKNVAVDGIDNDVDPDTDERVFIAGDSAKLVDTGDSAVITIKDERVDASNGTLDTLLDAGRDFEVQEMGLVFYPDGHDPEKMVIDIKLHKNGAIKKLAVRDLTDADLDRVIERFDGQTLEEEDDRSLRPMAGLYIIGHVLHQLVKAWAEDQIAEAGLGFMSDDDREMALLDMQSAPKGDDDSDEWEDEGDDDEF